MSAVVFRNARLLDPQAETLEEGGLVVEHGHIVDIGHDVKGAKGTRIIDAAGLVLAPGMIDSTTFAIDRIAALAGGITSILLMPDASRPPIDRASMVQLFLKGPHERDWAGPRVYPTGAATQGLDGAAMAELGLMAEAGAPAFSDGNRTIGNAGLMRRLLAHAARFERPVIQKPEDPALARCGVMHEGATAARLGLPGIPAEAEALIIERDARLARASGGHVHFAPLATAEGLASLTRLKDEGAPVTAATTPAYFHLNDEAVGDYRTFARLSPPLRSEADRLAIREAVTEGRIDMLCSAHTPLGEDDKRLPFEEAAPGAIGYETLLPLSLTLVHDGAISLPALWRMLSLAPAELLGLPQGRLAIGAPADLILFDPEFAWRIEAASLHSDTANTPFDGLPVHGRTRLAMVGGRILFDERDAL
ncbi:MAG: dihydroorotase [Alphaproteobacteria bacterium]|nr:MAG: dihydroorotase [Alphaproteobacteria bacterium]